MKKETVSKVVSIGLAGLTAVSSTPIPVVADSGNTSNKYANVRSGNSGGSLKPVTGASNDEDNDTTGGNANSDTNNSGQTSGKNDNTEGGSGEGSTGGVSEGSGSQGTGETGSGTGNTEGSGNTGTEGSGEGTGGSSEGSGDGSGSESTGGENTGEGEDQKPEQEVKPNCYSLVEIADLSDVKSNIYINDGICYYTDMFLSVSAVSSVDGDKVTKVELVDENDKTKVYSQDDKYTDGDKIVFTMPETSKNEKLSGLVLRYTITREPKEDGGSPKEFTLEENVRDRVDSLAGVSEYRKIGTEDMFVVDRGTDTCTLKTIDGKDYLTEDGKMLWSYDGIIGIDTDKTECKLNGEAEKIEISATKEDGKVAISLNTDNFKDGDNTIELKVVDKLGREDTFKYDIYALRKGVVVSGNSHSDVLTVGNETYTKSGMTFNLNIVNGSTAVNTISLMNGNTVVQTLEKENLSGNFTINESGDYRVKVTDIFGNSTVYTLDKLFNDVLSTIVVDDEDIDVSVNINGEQVTSSEYYVDTATLNAVLTDENGISEYTVYVNGSEVKAKKGIDRKEASFSVDLSKVQSTGKTGERDIKITAKDYAGNEVVKEFTVKCDFSDPVISNIIIVGGKFVVRDNIAYTKKPFEITVGGTDTESGIKSISLYRRGVLVGTENSPSATFTADESGMYLVVIEDNVGHKVSKTLSELYSSLKDTENIVIDTVSPEIKRKSGYDGVELKGKSGVWFNVNPNMHFTVDDEYLETVKVSVNDSDDINMPLGNIYKVPEDNFVEGHNTVKVTATDIAGNVKVDNFSFNLDSTVPENVEASITAPYKEENGKVYFKDKVLVTVSAEDKGSGVATYTVDGESNKTGKFSLGSGKHILTVTDAMGNTTDEINIATLLGLDGDEFVVDSEVPVIERVDEEKPGYTEKNKDWYSKKPELKYRVSDDNLKKVEIKVNGNEEKVNGVDGVYSINLDDVTDGEVNVEITATDNSGNTSTETYVFMLDSASPVDVKASIEDEYKEYEGTVYFKKSPEVKVDAKDTGVGLSEVLVNGKAIKDSKFNITNGSFNIIVKDKLGNATEEYSLSELLGMNGNTFVIDGEDPKIIKEKGFAEDLLDNGKFWFAKVPDLVYSITDDNMQSIKITVNDKEYTPKIVQSGKYTINMDGVEDGVTKITVTVEDKAGNISKDTYEFNVDTAIPTEIKGKVDKDYVVDDYVMYFKEAPTLTLTAEDSGVGIGKYVLDDEENTTGKFKVKDGHHTIKVIDKLGNSSGGILLGSLLGERCNEIVIDGNGPAIKRESGFIAEYTDAGVDWYSKKPKLVYEVKDDNLKSVEIKVNGVKVDANGVGDNYTVDLSKVEDGDVKVEIVAKDKSGNTSSDTYTFKYDSTSPYDVQATQKEGYKEYDGKVYFKTSPEVTVSAKDAGVGVSNVLVNGEEIKNSKFNITDGSFSLVVKDKLGNTTQEYKLSDLLGFKGNTYVIDGIDPSIKEDSGFKEDLKSDDKLWFATVPELVYSISDVNIHSITITVGDKEYTPTINDEGKYKVNLTGIKDGEVKVGVTVEDKAGNVSKDTYVFSLDMSIPTEVTGKVDKSFLVEDDVMYFKEKPTLSLEATDSGVGVGKFIFDSDENTTGKFEVGDGNHLIKVEDKLGNTLDGITLGSLLGVDGNRVVIDGSAPVIKEESGYKADYSDDGKDWFGNVPTLKYSVKDANLKSIKVSVNGKSYDQDISNSGDYIVNLTGVADGKVTVVVDALDKSGNSSRDTYTFYLDRTTPKNLRGEIEESFNNLTNGVFFKKVPTLKLTAEDDGVGVSTFILNDNKNSTGNFKLTGGEYTVSVSDILGNTTRGVSLSSLLGLKSDKIVVDGVAPTINRNSGFSGNYSKGDQEWYSKIPNLYYSVSDDYLKSVQITVNGEGGVVTPESDGRYKVNLNGISDGEVKVIIKAEDYSGNTSKDTFTFYYDKTAPTGLKATLDGTNYLERDTGTFFKTAPSVTLEAKDSGVGVGNYILDGSKKRDGQYKLSDGTHTVSVEDLLGNKAGDVNLASLLGWKSNRVVVDGTAPEISASKPSGGVNNWYKSDQSYPVKITDNVAIQSATITINGKEVDKFDSPGRDVSNVTLTGNTNRVSANNDGSYNVVVSVTDKAGNKSEWKDTIYIDKSKPTVDKFVFSGAKISNGANIGGSGRYGFFFEGSGSVSIYASDGTVSSGVKEVVVTLNNKNSGTTTRTVAVKGGVAEVSIPSNFKGTISAHAVDNVGNEGSEERPDGIVSETSNWHNNSVALEMNLPKTGNKDTSGLPLYNSAVNIDVTVGCRASGIKSVKWGVDGKTLGSSNVSSSGNLSGNGSIQESDNNLVLTMKNVVPVSDNSNNLKVWVTVTDNMGNTSEISRNISIDTDKPIVTVTYDSEVSENGFYKESKTARISIEDRNFNEDGIKISGMRGTLGNWSKSGNRWTNTITFDKDGEYSWSLVATDMAGNKSTEYKSPKFAVDKEAPKVRFEYDDSTAKNGKYYDKGRKVTVVVDDFNFDEKSVKFEGNGTLGTWIRVGNTFKSTINCAKDGTYKFSFSCADKSGNKSETIESKEFIVDTKKPTIKVEGVSDGVSYKRNIKLDIQFSDDNLDEKNVKLSLLGRKNGVIEVKGDFDKDKGSYHFDGFEDDEKYDDVYTLRVYVADKAGNYVEKEYNFSLNRYGSHYSVDDAELFGNYLNAPRDVVLKEENVDRLKLNQCRVVVVKDGKELKVDKDLIKITEDESTSGWTYTYKVGKSVFTEDGAYSIQVYSSASDGTKYSSVSEEYSFILDTKKPEVLLGGIESGKTYREYSRNVTIDVRDLSGVDKIVAKVNGEEIPVSESEGMYSLTVVENGEYQTLVVEVTDKAGNKTEASVENYYLTTNPLVFVVNQPWFKFGAGAFVGFTALIIGLSAHRIMRNRREEERILLEQKAMYDKSRSSSGGSLGGSGNGSDGTTEGVSEGTTEEQTTDSKDTTKD